MALSDSEHHEPSELTRKRMIEQRTKDTGPELALRRELHRQGLRYRLHRHPLPEVRREADLIFPKRKVAVFVDGCFWHGCSRHRPPTKTNTAWWKKKIDGNRSRDRDTDRRLREAGWVSIRVWEHEDPVQAAERIRMAVAEL